MYNVDVYIHVDLGGDLQTFKHCNIYHNSLIEWKDSRSILPRGP